MIQSIRQNVTWRAIPIAGLLGGTVFLLVAVLFSGWWLGVSPAVVLYYFASLVMGEAVLLEQSTLVLLVGVLVHFVLSIVFALIIAIVVHRWGIWVGIIGGAILGLSLYSINLFTVTIRLSWFPWFFTLNSGLLVLCHVLYGAVTGGVYEMLDQFDVSREAEATQ